MKPTVKELYRLLQYFSVMHAFDGERAELVIAELIPEGTGHPWVDDAKSLAPRHIVWADTLADEHIVVVEYKKR